MARPDLMWIIRLASFGTVLVFSVIVLGLSAHYVAQFGTFREGAFEVTVSAPDWANFALAVSIISIVSLGPMVVIDFLRRGAMTSWIIAEIAVTGILWVLWLASAADTTSATDGISVNCGTVDEFAGSALGSLCHSYQAIEAFGFLNWLILMAYSITLIVVSFMSSNQGNKAIWQSSVRETEFFQGKETVSLPMTQPYAQQTGTPHPLQAASQYNPHGTPSPQPSQPVSNGNYTPNPYAAQV